MSGHDRISVAAPMLGDNERRYVNEAVASTWISSKGRFLDQFEVEFARFCGVRHAVACNNGTTALHLAMVGLGLKEGDEVIMPSLTYIATANCAVYCGAKPVFVDSDPRTFNIDPAAIEARITPRTRGIVVVHLYGHPVDMDPVMKVAERHGLWVIEDAAEAHGATYKGRTVGGIGHAASFSFFGNKIITTGEGGMVTTNDDAIAERLRLYRGQGMDPERRYWHPVVGYNYRMTNVAAALGVAQLERVHEALAARRRLAEKYAERLAGNNLITLPHVEPWARHVFWMYTVLLAPEAPVDRDAVMAFLDAEGIETRPVFYPVHVMPPYADSAVEAPNSVYCAARGINLPTHELLTDAHLDRICETLARATASGR